MIARAQPDPLPNYLAGLLEILGSIGACLELNELRSRTIDYLLEVFGVSTGAFYISGRDAQNLNMSNVFLKNVRTEWYEAYRNYYQHLDPHYQLPLGTKLVTTIDDVLDEGQKRTNEYYNVFLKGNGYVDLLALYLTVRNKLAGAVVIFRTEEEPAFDAAAKGRAEYLAPFLAKALERVLIVEYMKRDRWVLESSVQGLGGPGILVLEEDLQVVFANDVAQELLGGASPSPGRLGRRPVLSGQLAARCSRIARSPAEEEVPRGEAVEEFEFEAEGGVLSARMRVISGSYLGQEKRFLIINLRRPARPLIELQRDTAEVYGLTPREVEIVEQVLSGAGKAQIANALFISAYTVDNHLKSIYRKMQVKGRAELICRLLNAQPGTRERSP